MAARTSSRDWLPLAADSAHAGARGHRLFVQLEQQPEHEGAVDLFVLMLVNMVVVMNKQYLQLESQSWAR